MPMLKIRQSYHGTGGPEGYRYKVYDEKNRKLGEIPTLPLLFGVGSICRLNAQLFEVIAEYDSPHVRDDKTEVVFFELTPYEFKPDFDLGDIRK